MRRVTGIGGIFFKVSNKKEIKEWYMKHLGLKAIDDGEIVFKWNTGKKRGNTILSFFPQDTKYLEPSQSGFMINFRVENLSELLKTLKEEGVTVLDETEDPQFGKFGWILDPDNNKIELWEPPENEDWNGGMDME